MSADDGGVDHLDAACRHAGRVQCLQHRIPDPGDGPAAELTVDGAPLAELLGQIPLGRTCPGNPEHAIQNQAMIAWGPTPLRSGLDHKWLEKRPFLVRHHSANHRRSPKEQP